MKAINSLIVTTPIVFFLLGYFDIFQKFTTSFYDSWRLNQCLVLLVSLILFGVINYQRKIALSKKAVFIGMLIFGSVLFTILQVAQRPNLAILDVLLYGSMAAYGYVLYSTQKTVPKNVINYALAGLVLLPVYYLLTLFIGWILYFTQHIPPVSWQIHFENIRYYDDTLLPLLFLLWYCPSFFKRYPSLVFILSSLYLLTLWLDGARANWLGIFVSLLASGFVYRQQLKGLLLPIASVVFSAVLYLLVLTFIPASGDGSSGIARTSTSGRYEIWMGTLSTWLEQIIFGIGGGNFATLPYSITMDVGHPHNIVLQLVVEWGLAGIVVVVSLIYLLSRIYKSRGALSPVLFAGCIAISINTLLSGALVYPTSQMAIVTFFAVVCYQLYFLQSSNRHAPLATKTGKVFVPLYTIILFPILLMWFVFIPNIIPSINPNSSSTIQEQGWSGPRFWLNSQLSHLPNKS